MAVIDAHMLDNRVRQALSIRRYALWYLRIGNRLEHRLIMQQTRLPLLQARQWKPKS